MSINLRISANLWPLAVIALTGVAACGGGGGGADGGGGGGGQMAQWKTAMLIETSNTGNAQTPRIAFDASGNALAIWQQLDNASFNVSSNRYTAGGGWGSAALIAGGSGSGGLFPQIAFDANGNALAVWEQPAGPYLSIWSSHYTAGGGWDAPVLAETNDAGTAVVPHIAFDAQGNALALWYQSDGAHFNVWSNRYTTGGGWGTAVLIGTDNPGNWFFYDSEPQIAMDANGNALVVWQQIDGSVSQIWSNRYTAGAGWGTAEAVVPGQSGEPQIAMDADGSVLAVWLQSDGTTGYVWSNRYTAGAGWGTSMQVSGGGAINPQIALDAHGNALAAWDQSNGTHTRIWSSRYTTGSGWDAPVQIETGNAVDTGNPVDETYLQIACDTRGNALVVWQESDGTRDNIWSNRYTVGSGWGTAAMLETNNAGDATLPQIAMDPSGNALAVWQQSDGARTNIWSNRFEAGKLFH
jgi:hypothetical protein